MGVKQRNRNLAESLHAVSRGTPKMAIILCENYKSSQYPINAPRSKSVFSLLFDFAALKMMLDVPKFCFEVVIVVPFAVLGNVASFFSLYENFCRK